MVFRSANGSHPRRKNLGELHAKIETDIRYAKSGITGKNIFNLEEVQYAVLELNGKISVLRKPKYLPVTRKDLKLKPNIRQHFPIELIMDGQIIEDNLKDNGITKEWLLSQVRKRGLSIEKINYAVKSSNGSLYIDPFEDHISQPIDQE
jgi:uncharacterized membrane protein YcaP (DUF421 family)